MKTGTIIAVILSVLGLSAMVIAFIGSASPYVTIAEAKTQSGDNLHVAGEILPGTVFTRGATQQVSFKMKDQNGEEIPVLYTGAAPANMGSVAKVVAVGGMKDGVFQAHKLWIKCPSKYESQKGASENSAKL